MLPRLRAAGLVQDEEVEFRPLEGGVSSDIYLVQTATNRLVVKAALGKLRVRDDWFADVSRNNVEQNYLAYAARCVPEAVPRILTCDASAGWFAMEYLGQGYTTWKERLLAGEAQPHHARQAGRILGILHRTSWNDPFARERFATLKNFHELRIAPYLLTTAERLPQVSAELSAEARRLAETEIALVHGDYSPKNILIGPDRVVILDAEAAWFGDPAFDLAFLLTHLHLKALLHSDRSESLLSLVPAFYSAYGEELGKHADKDLTARTVRLLLCLLLARVHGKSPVEYLTAQSQRDFVTRFAISHLKKSTSDLTSVTQDWLSGSRCYENQVR